MLTEVVENDLHLLGGFEPCAPPLDAEVFVEQRAVEALDDAVGLRALHPGGSMLDLLQLQEEFVWVLVGSATELAAVVGQHGLDPCVVGFEGGDDVAVHQMDGSDRQLGGVEPRPGVAAVTVDGRSPSAISERRLADSDQRIAACYPAVWSPRNVAVARTTAESSIEAPPTRTGQGGVAR